MGGSADLQRICAASPMVVLFLSTLTLPLSKGARQERWEKQRMIERTEEGQEDSRNINPQFSQPLLPPVPDPGVVSIVRSALYPFRIDKRSVAVRLPKLLLAQ